MVLFVVAAQTLITKSKLYELELFESRRLRQEKGKLKTTVMEIMYHVAGQLMRTGKLFVLENNFENASKKGLNGNKNIGKG